MRGSRLVWVGGASAAIVVAGFAAAPPPIEVAEPISPTDDPCDVDGNAVRLTAADDSDRDIDPDDNSGRGNADDPIEERLRDDDPDGDDDDPDERDDDDGDDDGEAPATPSAPAGTDAEQCAEVFAGPVVTNLRGGYQVQLHVEDGQVVDVTFPEAGTEAAESRRVNEMALPQLRERILEAQTWDVEYVSGASYTSPAMVESAQQAFADAGL